MSELSAEFKVSTTIHTTNSHSNRYELEWRVFQLLSENEEKMRRVVKKMHKRGRRSFKIRMELEWIKQRTKYLREIHTALASTHTHTINAEK